MGVMVSAQCEPRRAACCTACQNEDILSGAGLATVVSGHSASSSSAPCTSHSDAFYCGGAAQSAGIQYVEFEGVGSDDGAGAAGADAASKASSSSKEKKRRSRDREMHSRSIATPDNGGLHSKLGVSGVCYGEQAQVERPAHDCVCPGRGKLCQLEEANVLTLDVIADAADPTEEASLISPLSSSSAAHGSGAHDGSGATGPVAWRLEARECQEVIQLPSEVPKAELDSPPVSPASEAQSRREHTPRQRIFSLSIDRSDDHARLGISVSQHDGRTLLILEVKKGLVSTWNKEHPSLAVKPGDRILQVNSVQNRSHLLLKECEKQGVLDMTIKRARVLTPEGDAAQRRGPANLDSLERRPPLEGRDAPGNLPLERTDLRKWSSPSSISSNSTTANLSATSVAAASTEAPEHFRSDEAFRSLLADGDVALLHGSWLADLARRKAVMPRRQELPDGAAWNSQALFKANSASSSTTSVGASAGSSHSPVATAAPTVPAGGSESGEARPAPPRRETEIVVVSHCWLTSNHPDPDGEQLSTLGEIVDKYLQSEKNDLAIFFDWCSLYQLPRTDSEQEAFERSLDQVSLWYVHQHTWKWMLTKVPERWTVPPFKDRGWPTFERVIGEMVTQFDMVLDLGKFDRDRCQDWRSTTLACAITARSPPVLPETFARDLEAKTFANAGDRTLLVAKYQQTFQDIFGAAARLDFSFHGWGDEEARRLSDALPCLARLRCLYLNWNQIGDTGAEELAAKLPLCEFLRELSLAGNPISTDGGKRLREAWRLAGKPEQQLILW